MADARGQRILLLAALCLGAAASAWAAETLDWQSCVNEAAKGNASLQAARQELRAGERRVDSSRGGYYPEVSADASYDYGDKGGTTTGNTHSYSAGVNATQNVFGGFSDVKNVEQAQAEVLVAAAALEIARAQVSYDLKIGFQDLLFAQASEELTAQIIARRTENYRLVSLRYDSGRENKGSVLLFKAYLEQAKYDDLQARNNIEIARAQLRRVLGRDDAAPFDVSGEAPIGEPPAAPDFVALARQTPRFRQAIFREQADLAAVSLSQSPLYPSLDVGGGYARKGGTGSDQNIWSVGADLSVPLFSGLRDYYSVESARARAEASGVNALDVAREARAELEQTYAAFVEAAAKVGIDAAFLEAATARAEIARTKYNNGLLSFEDWDVIENDLILRQKNYLRSLRDLVAGDAAWQQAQGKAVFE